MYSVPGETVAGHPSEGLWELVVRVLLDPEWVSDPHVRLLRVAFLGRLEEAGLGGRWLDVRQVLGDVGPAPR